MSGDRLPLTPAQVVENRAFIDAVVAHAASLPWTGQTGATDLRILQAHFKIARKAGSPLFTASTRQIAELVPCAHDTVGRCWKRCSEWIEVVRRGRGKNGSLLRIRPNCLTITPLGTTQKENILDNSIKSINGVIVGQYVQAADPDLFRRGGLPSSAPLIFGHLVAGIDKPADLVKATGKCPSTVHLCLKWLEFHGLAFRAGYGRWTALDGPIEAIRAEQHRIAVENTKTAGRTEMLRERHRRERDAYRDRLQRPPRRSLTDWEAGDLKKAEKVWAEHAPPDDDRENAMRVTRNVELPDDELVEIFDRAWEARYADEHGHFWIKPGPNHKVEGYHRNQLAAFQHLWNNFWYRLGRDAEWLAAECLAQHVQAYDLTYWETTARLVRDSWADEVEKLRGALSNLLGRHLTDDEQEEIVATAALNLTRGAGVADLEQWFAQNPYWIGQEAAHEPV